MVALHCVLLVLIWACIAIAKDARETLQLAPEASEIDIQVAYKNLLTKRRGTMSHAELAEAQVAYQSLSDFDMQDEALSFIDYWADVEYLHTDEDLRRFAELQVGGSAHLRVLYAANERDAKSFEIFATAIRYFGRVRVGQVHHKSMLGDDGRPLPFYASLKIFAGGVVIFDPISRASKTTYDVLGVGSAVRRFLEGDTGGTKLGRVQELDRETYTTRCGVDQPKDRCSESLLLATDKDFEATRTEHAQLMKEYVEACRALQVPDKYPGLTCFWLRLDRSPEWAQLLRQHGAASIPAGTPIAAFFRRDPSGVVVSPAGEALPGLQDRRYMELSTPETARWSSFDGVAYYSVGITRWFNKVVHSHSLKAFTIPALPAPFLPSDEPQETTEERLKRYYRMVEECVQSVPCMQGHVERLLLRAGVIASDSTEEAKQTMLVGSGLFAAVVLLLIVRRCCCCCCQGKRRGSSSLSEEEILKRIQMIVPVSIKRVSSEARFGMGMEPCLEGGFTITKVDPAGLMGRSNETQTHEALKVRAGDRIVAVTHSDTGKDVRCTTTSDITKAFGMNSLVIEVALNRGDAEVVHVVGSIDRNGIDPSTDFVTREVDDGNAGLEILSLSPKVEERNAKVLSEGRSLSQVIEKGDRLVVQGAKDNSYFLVVKLRVPNQVQTSTFEVNIEKTGPQDRLGMQVRQYPRSPAHMEVLEVLPDGAVARVCGQPGSAKVLGGDRLVSANGKEGNAEMNGAFRESTVKLRFERYRAAGDGGAVPSVAAAPASKAAPDAAPAAPPLSGTSQAPPASAVPPVMGAPQMATPQPPQMASAAAAPVPQPMPQQAFVAPVAAPPVRTAPVAAAYGTSAAAPDEGSGWFLAKMACLLLVVGTGAWVAAFGNKPPPMLRYLPQRLQHQTPLPEQSVRLLDAIHPDLRADFGFVLVFIGMLMVLRFILYEIAMLRNREERSLLPQLCTAYIASSCLGSGSFLLFAWAGAYANA